jgi:hypothetical protein
MTENQIKEALSRNFVRTVVNSLGHKFQTPSDGDHGGDCMIVEVTKRIINDEVRYLDSGRKLDIQLKATTEESIQIKENTLKFKLEAKTYNDLVFRLKEQSFLFLVLFILPSSRGEWLNFSDSELALRKNAYWFLPNSDNEETKNSSSITVQIPLENRLDFNTIKTLFDIQYNS